MLARNIINLNLSQNKIEKIDILLISEGAKKLRELDLSQNRIAKFYCEQKCTFSSLRSLNLSSNLISDDPLDALFCQANFVKLKSLDLSSNRISHLHKLILEEPFL